MALLVLYGVVLLLGAMKGGEAGPASGQDPKPIQELRQAEDPVDLAVNEQSRREDASDFGGLTPVGVQPGSCEDDSDGIPLCRECKYVHELSSDYFPQYLQERKCQGEICLTDEGKCVQQYMDVEVRNIAPDREGDVTIVKLAAGCKCLLHEGSLFEVFVENKK